MAARLRRRSTSARSRIPRSRAAPEEAGRPRIRPIVCGTPPRPAPRTRSGARDGGVTRPALYRATVPMVPGDGRHAARLGAGGAGAARGGHCAAPRGTDRVHGDDARGRPVLPRLARRGTGAGRCPAEALATVEDALATAPEEVWKPDLLRVRGDLLARQGAEASAVEASYREAMDLARRHGAKAFELRAATSFGRWLQAQGRAVEARDLLAPIYGWFTEGFDTRDLREAKALLEELG